MRIILFDDHLRINLGVLEKIGAAKTSFYIPYENIVSAFSESPHEIAGFKIAGTNFPKLLELGTFLHRLEKRFCYIKRRKNDFLILVLKSNFYSKIILELQDSSNIADEINKRMKLCRLIPALSFLLTSSSTVRMMKLKSMYG